MKILLQSGKSIDVSINSLLVPVEQLKPEAVDAIRNACMMAVLEKAVDTFGERQRMTLRDLNAADMAYANNIFTETSHATANQWNAMAFGAFTVARGTVIGIYGLGISVVHDATIDFHPITGIRLDVGGARVAQWHVQSLAQNTSAASVAPTRVVFGLTKSPVVVNENVTVTIYEYTRTASTVYEPCWLGIIAEKEGLTLKP